jgi:DMSO/TMAO reductase YedYZ heme-binding membrane subunit
VHVITTVLDSFVSIPLSAAIIPFANGYKTFWLGLGAVAFDLMLAVLITSMLRQRIGYGVWRAVHWLSYACWPIALLHTFGTGSDASRTWLLALSVVCIAAVLAAVLARLLPMRSARRLATR